MLPIVIASRDGTHHLEVLEFEGAEGIQNRDAIGYYYRVRLSPKAEPSRIAVLFSGTSYTARPEHFGLPDLGDRELNFQQFALAAIGDYLDDEGTPATVASSQPAAKIECFSAQLHSWKTRTPADDDTLIRYLKATLYTAWLYGHVEIDITPSDLLRLGVRMNDVDRLIHLEEGHLWTTTQRAVGAVRLKHTTELIRAERAGREPPLPQPADTSPSMPASSPGSTPAPKSKRRSPKSKPRKKESDATDFVFVDETRITDLRSIASSTYDLRKVLAICTELNLCYRTQCYFAVAALTRALLDHVPPIFGVAKFAEVANNYPGTRSFKESMQHLENSARKIADGHLHTQIRDKESLPSRTQINFTNDLDVLLAEIARMLSK